MHSTKIIVLTDVTVLLCMCRDIVPLSQSRIETFLEEAHIFV